MKKNSNVVNKVSLLGVALVIASLAGVSSGLQQGTYAATSGYGYGKGVDVYQGNETPKKDDKKEEASTEEEKTDKENGESERANKNYTTKGQDTFGKYGLTDEIKKKVDSILEKKKSIILKNKAKIYAIIEKYLEEYEAKDVKDITKQAYIKYEFYNYIYETIKNMETM